MPLGLGREKRAAKTAVFFPKENHIVVQRHNEWSDLFRKCREITSNTPARLLPWNTRFCKSTDASILKFSVRFEVPDVDALEQPFGLLGADRDAPNTINLFGPRKLRLLEALFPHSESRFVPVEGPHAITATVHENKKGRPKRILAQLGLDERREALTPLAKVWCAAKNTDVWK